MIIAQITDTHIVRKGRLLHHMGNTAKQLKRTVERLNAMDPRPDLVIASGDLTESGKRKEYDRLVDILDGLKSPLYVMPGNHDDRQKFREAFAHHPYLPTATPTLSYVIESYAARIICLDSTEPGYTGGVMDEQRLTWLRSRLQEEPDRPTFIFVHHPPFKTGINALDAVAFKGVQEFGAIVSQFTNVQRVCSGHIHRTMQVLWNGTIACTAPSTAHEIVLAKRKEQPLGLAYEPAGFLLHVFDEGVTVTHTCVTDRPKGFPFTG